MTDTSSLPSWDEATGSQKPSWDEAVQNGSPAIDTTMRFLRSNDGYGQPANTDFLQHTAAGRILDAFGMGVKQGADTEDIISPEVMQSLRKAGAFNDYANGEMNIGKAINEGVAAPVASALNLAWKGANAFMGGIGATVQQTANELGGPLPELAEYGLTTPAFAGPHEIPHVVREGQAHGVVGVDEAQFMGTKELTPEQSIAQHVATEDTAAPMEVPKAESDITPETKLAPDIHAVARQIAPTVFNEYDRLAVQRDTLSRWMSDFSRKRQEDAEAGAPHNDEIAELQAKLEDANARKTKIYQAQLDDLLEKNKAAVSEASASDTPEIAQVRERLQQIDYRMRDLAPDVSAAYRQAEGQLPKNEDTSEQHEAVEQSAPEIQNQAAPIEKPEAGQPPENPAPKFDIAADVSKNLVGAGRPAEEANAAAQLVAEHYKAIAEQGWTSGSAEDIYQRDMANVRAGREKVKELAQGGKRGSLSVVDDAKNTITLMKSANASTFIHEVGHHWLDEMMQYAEAEDAPDGLKADAKTVREWLGVPDDADFRARLDNGRLVLAKEHEVFARGFERYLMEGTAPSQQLAGVFAKFKQWLTNIYQTVQKLKSPITDDIRDVFDRLLSANPEKTVIAPDHEPGAMLANIHEQDAAETPPEQAAGVADNIRTEIKSAAKQDKEAADVIAAIEARRGAGDSGGIEPAPVNSVAEEPSAVGAGGSEAPPKGKPAGSEPGTGARDTGRGPPENPNAEFGKAKSDLVDKAGNIRLDNLNTPEDVNEVLRQTAGDNDNFMQARRGVIPVGEQLNLADALGMNPSDLKFRKIGEAFNAEQIIAARKLLIQSAMNVRDLMNGNDVAAYAEAKMRHLMIQEHVAGITAEAGRALGAFRKLEGSQEAEALGGFLKQATGKDLFQLQQEMEFGKSLETPAQVAKFLDATKKTKFRDMVLEYYINCLISGPVTHFRYSIGNAINALATPLLEVPIQAAIGAAREAISGKPVEDRVYLGEAGAQLHGIFKGSQDGLKAAATAFRTGNSPLLPMEHASANFSGEMKVHAIPGKVGDFINLPSKSVAAIHSFFKSIRYEQNIQALAYRTAMQEGLEGDTFTNRVSDLTGSPTEDMMKASTANSLKELYMNPTDYNSAMGQLNRAINNNLAAKIIVPFMKIGSQITRNAFIERTPLGLLDSGVRADISAGGAAADVQLGKMAFGTSLMGATSLMVMQGLATGDGPEDSRQRGIWLLNHRPNSIQIGNITIPYQGLGHLGMLMRFSANMTETASAWSDDDGAKLAQSFFYGLSKSVLDENFMRGIHDMLDAVYDERKRANYIRNFATNWLPFSVGLGQTARMIDPDQREAHSILQEAWSKIPFASESLMPRRDRFGEPIPNGGPLPDYSTDPVVQRLEALHTGIGTLERKIRGVQLDDQQYDDYARMAGRMTKMRLSALVSGQGFSGLPAQTQIETIDKAIAVSRETARRIVMMQYPEIIQKANDAKRAALSPSLGN